MGGSRCSYRNCSLRSGINKVHMFHFPVYDKNRCHQWLANAQKFEFLNLKLSQLRNRIVCQYHFKDDCFMNYKKDKLTHNAVPTEDGPHCERAENTESQGTASVFPFILNENEDDDKYIKKHKSSIIYADFLTNGDYWEKQSLNETIWNNKVMTNKADSLLSSKVIDIPPSKIEPVKNTLIMPNTCSDGVSIKMIEIENPMDRDIKCATKENISDQIVNIATPNVTTDTIKESLRNRNSNYSLNDSLVSKELLNTAANQDLNNIYVTQDVKKMPITQGKTNKRNNNIDELNSSNNIVIEQLSDVQWYNNPKPIQPTEIQSTESSAPIQEKSVVLDFTKEIPVEFESIRNPDLGNFTFVPYERQNNRDDKEEINIKPKIKILFEEKITEPIKIPDKLEPISPSTVINISSIKEKTTDLQTSKKRSNRNKSFNFGDVTNDNIESSLLMIQNSKNNRKSFKIIPKLPVSKRNSNKSLLNSGDVTKENIKSSLRVVQGNNKNGKPTEIIPKMPAVKHKISPERIAAIEKKRNFNKKLRDLVETCLDKLDEQDRTSENVTAANSPNGKVSTARINTLKQNVGSYLSKQTELPSEHEYSMKYIEARMQKMEDVLLHKIEENSRKIVELKKCIVTKPQAHKSSGTQTSYNEELYKKQLYQEMSKYLSPDANSLVYEELFINRYAQKNTNQPSPRKRKRR